MMGMRTNGKKTEVIKVSDDLTPMKVTVGGVTLAETKLFKYLGSLSNSEASCDEEVKSRLVIARERTGELVPGFRHPGTYPKKTRWVFLGYTHLKKPTLLL